jgi:hypothetical protein
MDSRPGMGVFGSKGPFDVLRMPGHAESNPGYRAGEALAGWTEGRKLLKPLGSYAQALTSSGRSSALVHALLGGTAGLGYGWMADKNPLLWGLLGAGAGAAGGYGLNRGYQYMQNARNERYRPFHKLSHSTFSTADPLAYVQSRLFEDSSLASTEKARLMSRLGQVPSSELVTLADLLRTATGSAIGYMVSRFLLRFGAAGTAVSAGIGAMAGFRSGRPKPPRNMHGMRREF